MEDSIELRGWDYVRHTVKAFFTDDKNHFTRVVESAKGRDALVKGAVALSETAEAIIALTNASQEAREIVGNVTEGLKFSRCVFGFFQIFTGTIPRFLKNWRMVYLYAKQFFWGTEALPPPEELTEEEEKKIDRQADPFEAGCALFSEANEFVANGAYVFAFGVSGPIGCAAQLSKRKFSGPAGWLSKQFDFCRMINFGTKSLSTISTIAREIHRYNRTDVEGDGLFGKEKFLALCNKVDKLFRELLDKGSQFAYLLIKVGRLPAPLGLKLGLNLFSAGVGLYNIWQDTKRT